jgi:hypothetical protein
MAVEKLLNSRIALADPGEMPPKRDAGHNGSRSLGSNLKIQELWHRVSPLTASGDMVDVESRFLTRLSQAAILAAVRRRPDHLASQVSGSGHHPIRFANSSAPTATAGPPAAPPNQPTHRLRAAPHQSALFPYPGTCELD